ncbi:MAG: hypothetical protein OIF51_21620 [Cellvibrionaceae bacterium]|nr:hypothetical protein [Cellvibrionaceae bacterium]
MNLDDKIKLIEALAETSPKGATVIGLSNKINIPQSSLREFFQSNKDYICSVAGSEKYVLNRTGPFQASKDAIIKDLYLREQKSKEQVIWVYIIIAFLTGFIVAESLP